MMDDSASLARAPWVQNLPIAMRLGMAFGLLLAFLCGVIAFSLHQSASVAATSHEMARAGLAQVTLAHRAQAESQLAAGYLHSLFLLDEQKQRIPVYALMDRATAARNAALDALVAGSNDAGAAPLMERVGATRARFSEAFQETVEAVEINVNDARPLMVRRTLPAMREMLSALDALASFETERANARLVDIDALQADGEQRILALGIAALGVALASAFLITRSVARPMAATVRFAGDIAAGRMDTPLPVAGRDEMGSLVRALGHMRQNLVEREERIAQLAFRDSLTGVANRTLFNERLNQAISVAGRAGHRLSVIVLDLDRFKEVNDVLGHDVGDALLVQVTARLSAVLARGADTLARLGGDEFAVLLPTQGSDAAQEMAKRLLRTLEAPVALNGQTVDVSGSMGIATFPEHALEGNTLMARADTAMYVAKQSRSGYACFSDEMEKPAGHGLGLLSDLRRALEGGELMLYYQPKLDIGSGRCTSAEALVRWRHPQRGNVAPVDFIPFAERTGFIRFITAWVLREAIGQMAQWQREGLNMSLNVNISARDLTQLELCQLVTDALARHGLPAERLCLEVTEGAIMEEPARALATLEGLHAMGVRLSIDDFGTGYSSLAYLKQLPMDELKIDRSFVHDMDQNESDATIVRSTIDLAHNLGLRVVAEGVESPAVLEILRRLGCDEVQGYLFFRPAPAEEFARFMQTNLVDAVRQVTGVGG
jgi:diguanylate cyclase (GGDEF)-like protein